MSNMRNSQHQTQVEHDEGAVMYPCSPIASVKNMENTCYINSIIFYSLRFVPMFTFRIHELVDKMRKLDRLGNAAKLNILSMDEYQMVRFLQVAYDSMTRSELGVLSLNGQSSKKNFPDPLEPTSLIYYLGRLNPEYANHDQQDACEFLADVLNWLQKCCNTLIEITPKVPREHLDTVIDFIRFGREFYHDYFAGTVKTTIECLDCCTASSNEEDFCYVSVELPNETENIAHDWINTNLLKGDLFDGENKYRCNTCNKKTLANKSIDYPKLPKVLIVQLKRFELNSQNEDPKKLTDFASTPMALDCFCHQCQSYGVDENHSYQLNAVVVHRGNTTTNGHYITYGRLLTPVSGQPRCCGVYFDERQIKRSWFKCDDEKINVISRKQIADMFTNKNSGMVESGETPYLLFYAQNGLIAEHQA